MEAATDLQDSQTVIEEAHLASLLAAVGNKDRQAFEAFYDATSPRVLGLALRVTRQREIAEEVVCDVYVQVWENSAKYDSSRGTVIAWLMMACRSRAIDALRREKSRSGDADSEALLKAEQRQEQEEPQDLLQAVDRETRVYGALKKLNSQQRQLVALAFFRGYTHTEIAQFTATPVGTVKTQIRRALISLRGYLTGTEGIA